ncbi:MAG: hypothetical protein AVDCRST_MAG32-303, partial [uncultured Nocardioides sp.]
DHSSRRPTGRPRGRARDPRADPRARALRTRARLGGDHRGGPAARAVPRGRLGDDPLPRRGRGRGDRRDGRLVRDLLDLDRPQRDLARGPLRAAGAPRWRTRQGAAGGARGGLRRAWLAAAGVDRARLEHPVDRVLPLARGVPDGRLVDPPPGRRRAPAAGGCPV